MGFARTCGKAGHGGSLRGGAPRLWLLREPQRCQRSSAQPAAAAGSRARPRKWLLSAAFPSSGPGGEGLEEAPLSEPGLEVVGRGPKRQVQRGSEELFLAACAGGKRRSSAAF